MVGPHGVVEVAEHSRVTAGALLSQSNDRINTQIINLIAADVTSSTEVIRNSLMVHSGRMDSDSICTTRSP